MPCSVCGAAVSELRRGRCWGCYTRWAESRPVGRGASCAVCHEKRRNQLKLVELKGRSLPFCHGCAAQVLRLVDVPETIDELRLVLRRERRDGDRREGEKVDQRIFPRERRVGERRGPSRDGYADTDPRMRAVRVRGRRHRAGRDRHGRRRADPGPRPAAAAPSPPSALSGPIGRPARSRANQRKGSSTFQVLPSWTVRIAWRSPAAETPRPRPRRRRCGAGASRPAPRRAAASRP